MEILHSVFSRGHWFKSHSQFLLFIYACVHPVYILRVIINVRCSLLKKSEWSSGNTSLSCSRGTGFKSHSHFLLFIYAGVHPVYILRLIINVRCSLITKSEWSSGNTSHSCSRRPWFKSHSQFLLFISACVHNVYILRVIINVICSSITKSEWSSGNTSLSFSRGPWFKSHSQFLLFISACVHNVYILRVIINVICSSITKSEWSSGNTSLSFSRGPWFKSHSQFLLFISACVHPVYILRVIINVRCSLIKKSEWSSGNTWLSCSRGTGVQIPLSVFSFYICLCPSCVHPKGYN